MTWNKREAVDGMRGCRKTGRYRIRLPMVISLHITLLIPQATKLCIFGSEQERMRLGQSIHHFLLSAACTEVQALNSIPNP